MAERKIPTPPTNPESERFWKACNEGQFLLGRNKDTGDYHYYPRTVCPFTFSTNVEWVPAKGTGVIYTYSVMRRAEVPYCIAYVTLAEGPSVMTNIVDCDLDTIAVGKAVELVWKDADGGGQKVPCFTLS